MLPVFAAAGAALWLANAVLAPVPLGVPAQAPLSSLSRLAGQLGAPTTAAGAPAGPATRPLDAAGAAPPPLRTAAPTPAASTSPAAARPLLRIELVRSSAAVHTLGSDVDWMLLGAAAGFVMGEKTAAVAPLIFTQTGAPAEVGTCPYIVTSPALPTGSRDCLALQRGGAVTFTATAERRARVLVLYTFARGGDVVVTARLRSAGTTRQGMLPAVPGLAPGAIVAPGAAKDLFAVRIRCATTGPADDLDVTLTPTGDLGIAAARLVNVPG